ncbi:MAG: RAMP superfamily CRISPR-associated protein [Bacteroidota bacterium]
MSQSTTLTHRFIARYLIETQTPLGVGAGTTGLENERMVALDANGLPYIPGTGITGVLRHMLEASLKDEETINKLFGYQSDKENDGQGSLLTVSPACLVDLEGSKVIEGIIPQEDADRLKQTFQLLLERDHVRINDRGVAVKYGKFAEKLVFKGTRFVFEIGLSGVEEDEHFFQALMKAIESKSFRLGAGTRNGFGAFCIENRKSRMYDLRQSADFDAYLAKTSSLNDHFAGAEEKTSFEDDLNDDLKKNWTTYKLNLTPEKYFIFGSGDLEYNYDEANWLDNFSKKEKIIEWEEGKGELSYEPYHIIPGTSVKGALAHRTAYHYNRLTKTTVKFTLNQNEKPNLSFDIEKALQEFDLEVEVAKMNYASNSPDWEEWIQKVKSWSVEDSPLWRDYVSDIEGEKSEKIAVKEATGESNEAVKQLFGFAKREKEKEEKKEEDTKPEGARGKVIIQDVYLKPGNTTEKDITHVSIDRFTGGAKEGALFDEKVVSHKDELTIEIMVEKDGLKDPKIKEAFELAIKDLCKGALPLGGNTAKGHGVFVGDYQTKIV